MKRIIAALAILASLLLSACGDTGEVATAITGASTQIPAAPAIALTGEALTEAFRAAGLPIGAVTIYTAETDPNGLLGRPNQYIAKASWHDTRLAAPANADQVEVSDGGGLEVWPDETAAKARMDYIQEIGKTMPALVEYDYVRGPVLLRLSKELTPDQAAEYEAAFNAMTLGQ